MSAEIVNLNRYRKERARKSRQAQAAENRARFGRTREDQEFQASVEEMRRRALEGAKLERDAAEARMEGPESSSGELDPGAVS